MTILIHLKMTGHIMYGEYVHDVKKNTWSPAPNERPALFDPYNRFIHVVFSLSNGKYFVLCDTRKFGKVTLINTADKDETTHLKGLGPEPLEKKFTFEEFKKRLNTKPKGNIKTVLMDQTVIAGIGNIYSDEMLWTSSIHPKSQSIAIPDKQLQVLYESMREVLNKGIDFGGDSMSDYRDIDGKRGRFQNEHNVYKKKDEKCSKKSCAGVIMREVINGRSAHFCNVHQKLYI
jgi:formamidopyrimidine-DNA glycosylase